MHERRAPSPTCREAVGEHADHGVEVVARERAIRPGATHQREQLVLDVLAARDFGGDLLRQHVERRVVRDDAVELAATDRSQQRRALDQIVPRRRQQPSLGDAAHRVAGAADALQQRGDAMRRADLADQIDVADVDAELERRGRHERLQRAGLQPVLGVEPRLLRQAAVMRGDRVVAEPLAQVTRQPFRQPPRVDEHQRRRVRLDQLGQPVVVLLPDLVRHHRVERRARNLDRQIDRAAMAFVDDRAVAARRRRCPRGSGRLPRPASASPTGRSAAAGARRSCWSRSSDSARWAPRRVPITAWISSTMTVRTVRSMRRLRSEVSSR